MPVRKSGSSVDYPQTVWFSGSEYERLKKSHAMWRFNKRGKEVKLSTFIRECVMVVIESIEEGENNDR